MRAVGARFEAQRHHPTSDDPRILSRGQVRSAMDPAGPQEIESNHFRVADPTIERQPGSFSISKRTGLPVLLWIIEARSLTRPAANTSRTRSATRSHPRSLLSTALLKSARSRG